MTAPDPEKSVTLGYTNWKEEWSWRTLIPIELWFGTNEWHPEPQWFVKAIDVEKNAERDFALAGFGSEDPGAILYHVARIREAAGVGMEPMLAELPGRIAADRARAAARITELLEANNRYLDRARKAEAERDRALAELAGRRMCVNCGRYAPAGHDGKDPDPSCIDPETGLSACTWDKTPEEAFAIWRSRYHEERARADDLDRRLAEALVPDLFWNGEDDATAIENPFDMAREYPGEIHRVWQARGFPDQWIAVLPADDDGVKIPEWSCGASTRISVEWQLAEELNRREAIRAAITEQAK